MQFIINSNKSFTLPIETKTNIRVLALSTCAKKLLVFDESGKLSLINLVKFVVLATMNMNGRVTSCAYVPNNGMVGDRFVVAVDKSVQLWRESFGSENGREFAPFVLEHRWIKHTDVVKSVTVSADGKWVVSSSKDLTCRIFKIEQNSEINKKDGADKWVPLVLAAHKSQVVNAFFSQSDAKLISIYTVTKDGTLFHYHFDPINNSTERLKVKLFAKHFFNTPSVKVRSCALKGNLLVVGFVNGVFGLYDMPDFNMIHSLSISKDVIDTVSINPSLEWLAFGSSKMGQLVVWEWQSETFILKQQGHYSEMNCLAYSNDGQIIATGGEDGKVKLWNASSGFCFVTFVEHEAAVMGVEFAKNGKIVVSCSIDGTVRAFDLVRYRNFKTMTSPKPVQFSSMAVDVMGELVLAGTMDTFEIFCWSIQTGRLLQVFSGHEGPVCSISIHPNGQNFISGSWDKTARVWDIYSQEKEMSVMTHTTDVLAVAYRPDGLQVAVSCLDGSLNFWNPSTITQINMIEGRKDISGGRSSSDFISAANSNSGKSFNSICYSADGLNLLAAGNSKYICIYQIENCSLLKKYVSSCNEYFGGVKEILNSKKSKECGPLDLVDIGDDSEDERFRDDKLPGVKKGDASLRATLPLIRTKSTKFSPTGRSFAACTTEGLLIYSMDMNIVFDPFDIDLEVTPKGVMEALKHNRLLDALILAFRLNEISIIDLVFNNLCRSVVKCDSSTEDTLSYPLVSSIASEIPPIYYKKTMEMFARALDSANVEIVLIWMRTFVMLNRLDSQGTMCNNKIEYSQVFREWRKTVGRLYEDLSKVVNENTYMARYLMNAVELGRSDRAHNVPRSSCIAPHSQHGVFSKFMDSLRQEASKNAEFQENVKIVSDKMEKLQSNAAIRSTKQVIELAKENVKKGNEKLSEKAKTVSRTVSQIYNTKLVKGRKKRRKYQPAAVQENSVMDNVTEKLEGLQQALVDEGSSFQYGGIRSKSYRERRKKEKIQEFERMKQLEPEIEVNPNAGSGIQLHKDSKWKAKWTNFKDNNAVFQSLFGIKKAYDESNNIFVHFAREMTGSIADRLRNLFEETETAKTIKKINEKNPDFTQEKFLKEAREFIIPEVLEALISRNLKVLAQWCSEGTFNVLKAKFDVEKKEFANIVESKILDLRHVELLSAKLIDDNPVMVITFNAQHLITYRVADDEASSAFAAAANKSSADHQEFYCDDKIENLYHVWALVKDVENDHPVTGGWKVMEMATRNMW